MFAEVLKTKPHNLHYLNRYIKFINYCIDNPILSKTEDHHICPKSSDLFPEFKSFNKYPWNKAKLTLRQHYIAHRLLWKAFGGRQSQAFKLMCDRLVLNKSRCYEEVRKEHIAYMTENNHNADGKQSKKSWESASDERRKRQAELMREVNKTKKRPKEERTPKCVICDNVFIRLEFCHHPIKEEFVCGHKCNGTRNGKKLLGRPNLKISESRKGKSSWNKGVTGTGFGNPKTNPMNNPDSVKKMLETRRINKEKKRGI